jgi:probable rRNA maturation factor
MARSVAITFLPSTRGRLTAPELRRIARAVLDAENVGQSVAVELVLADDSTVRDLNRLYRGKDEETDVLSFAAHEGEAFLNAPDEAPSLGEVIVSVAFVERQVQAHGGLSDAASADHELNPAASTMTVEGQLAHLLVHGLLHLIGLDHELGEAEEEAMREKEEALLADLGYEGLYAHGH